MLGRNHFGKFDTELGLVRIERQDGTPLAGLMNYACHAVCLMADNYLTSESFDQTFGGFGWQAWGGAGIPLGGGTRVNGEVFYNGSEVGSDVDVDYPGLGLVTVRDVVQMNGLGMRVGIAWGF